MNASLGYSPVVLRRLGTPGATISSRAGVFYAARRSKSCRRRRVDANSASSASADDADAPYAGTSSGSSSS